VIAALREVTKRFGDTTALASVDLDVHEGEVLALLGPNGAGKSTAIALLLGLRTPDEGSVWLNGLDPRRLEARRSVGVTPQETAFPTTLRVRELIEFVRRHFLRPASIDDLDRRLGLGILRDRELGGLSGGERRLVAVALAFAGAPRFVVLDEPTTGLDLAARRRVWQAIRDHAASGGTALLTTHQLEEADALASRVVVLDRGCIVAGGSVAEIKATAGLTHVSFRAPTGLVVAGATRDGDRLQFAVSDGGELVERLVGDGLFLADLEVRPLTLEEALARFAPQ
jgi:ABC-2 type transport system ATP-binding protein